ncbi:hypothetical protein ACWGB8_20945 [Kitasatospora sp. NPDC054939]
MDDSSRPLSEISRRRVVQLLGAGAVVAVAAGNAMTGTAVAHSHASLGLVAAVLDDIDVHTNAQGLKAGPPPPRHPDGREQRRPAGATVAIRAATAAVPQPAPRYRSARARIGAFVCRTCNRTGVRLVVIDEIHRPNPAPATRPGCAAQRPDRLRRAARDLATTHGRGCHDTGFGARIPL